MYEFYLDDCLDALPKLEKKYTTIYLDPPFNSNRNYAYSASKEKHGFNDVWEDGEYEKWLDQVISLCKTKLKKDGTLFFHISAELSFIPEKVLRKHFNKVEPIFWKKAHGKNTVKTKLGAVIDVIYKASENGHKFNLLYTPLDAYYFENSYRNKDANGYYALGSIKHDKTRKGHFYKIEKDGIIYDAPYGWKMPRSKLDELIRQNRIHYAKPKPGSNKGMLYKKLYKHECKGKPLSNLWDDIYYITRTTQDIRLYPTQKPVELLKRIIQLSSDKGDWVLDPVAGSGTTGEAALLLGRNVTLIDINKDAEKIIKKRLESLSLVQDVTPICINKNTRKIIKQKLGIPKLRGYHSLQEF
ncbi:MAG: site-specific DNA-methyltransferase [Deltaproteobacteria bacterium]|nr:site-specific DNA-methyltransferase [Deltaproteobacteria bacterium]